MIAVNLILVARLVMFYGPDRQAVEINPDQVTSVRTPRGERHISPDVHCLIFMADGKFISVMEDCQTVAERLALPR